MKMTRACFLAAALGLAAVVDASRASCDDKNSLKASGMGNSVVACGGGGAGAAAAAGGAGPTVVSGGTGTMANGKMAWSDVGTAKYSRVPEAMSNFIGRSYITTIDSTVKMQAEYVVTWECGGDVDCDMYVFVYKCPQCDGVETSGMMQHMIDQDGWTLFRCTPSVKFDDSDVHHTFVGFTKPLAKGGFEVLELPGATEYNLFGIDQYPVVCGSFANSDDCLGADASGKCVWEDGECKMDLCPPAGNVGPNLCTSKCINTETPFLE